MAETQSIEDVLSSIRRLVSEEVESQTEQAAKVTTEAAGKDALVLEPTSRVSEPEDPFQAIRILAQEERDARDAAAFMPETAEPTLTEDIPEEADGLMPHWDIPAEPSASLAAEGYTEDTDFEAEEDTLQAADFAAVIETATPTETAENMVQDMAEAEVMQKTAEIAAQTPDESSEDDVIAEAANDASLDDIIDNHDALVLDFIEAMPDTTRPPVDLAAIAGTAHPVIDEPTADTAEGDATAADFAAALAVGLADDKMADDKPEDAPEVSAEPEQANATPISETPVSDEPAQDTTADDNAVPAFEHRPWGSLTDAAPAGPNWAELVGATTDDEIETEDSADDLLDAAMSAALAPTDDALDETTVPPSDIAMPPAGQFATPPSQPAEPEQALAPEIMTAGEVLSDDAPGPAVDEAVEDQEDDDILADGIAEQAMTDAMTGAMLGQDTDALRDLVAEVVRQELAGALGERITRNVRKLVRRELRTMFADEEFD